MPSPAHGLTPASLPKLPGAAFPPPPPLLHPILPSPSPQGPPHAVSCQSWGTRSSRWQPRGSGGLLNCCRSLPAAPARPGLRVYCLTWPKGLVPAGPARLAAFVLAMLVLSCLDHAVDPQGQERAFPRQQFSSHFSAGVCTVQCRATKAEPS